MLSIRNLMEFYKLTGNITLMSFKRLDMLHISYIVNPHDLISRSRRQPIPVLIPLETQNRILMSVSGYLNLM